MSFILRRLGAIVPTLFFVSVMIFGLQQLLPGDPAIAMAGEERDPNVVAYLRGKFHLDEPLPVRYGYWLKGVVQGDLGESVRIQRPVTALPLSLSERRNSQSGLIFEAMECAVMTSSSRIEWISICFISEALSFFWLIRRVTKAIARISRIREELKLISLIRLRISGAVFGTPWRTIGLMCTITTSQLFEP